MGGESRFEGNQVIFKIISGINLSFLEGEMRVQSLELGTAAGEMLGHGGYAVRVQLFALVAEGDIGPSPCWPSAERLPRTSR